ncbi:MAG: hypothetical protein HC836_04640 [Richelia sp. RM2_1_2]|nr:hypothetical protein [Richelia sp. RM2_1_2]NJS16545.1 hypothetical protein [Nostocaceae cyanobacterium CSU_2_110]
MSEIIKKTLVSIAVALSLMTSLALSPLPAQALPVSSNVDMSANFTKANQDFGNLENGILIARRGGSTFTQDKAKKKGKGKGKAMAKLREQPLVCYSDKRCETRIWQGNSPHNCCTKRQGKSFRFDSDGRCRKCSAGY